MATDQANESRKQGFSEAQLRLLEKRMRGQSSHRHESLIEPRPVGSLAPLSAEQRRIWLHTSQYPDSAIYNEPLTIYRHGPLDRVLLEASFNEYIRRHEAWRTSITPDGQPVFHRELTVSIPYLDLSELPEQERQQEALRAATKDAQRPFDLEKAPLFRMLLIRMESEEHRLYMTLNHIIFDGVSISRSFLPEMIAIYSAFEQGQQSPLAEPILQYGDYAFWREQKLNSESTRKHIEYWVQQLAGELPLLRLPMDRPRQALPSHKGSVDLFRIPGELMRDLRSLAQSNGATLYMVLLAAFKVLLFRYSSQNDLIIGSPVDGRRQAELESVVGYFLDTVALRTRPRSDTSFVSYLKDVRDTVLEAFAAADVPFDRIVYEVKPKRDTSHHPIFQAFFSMRPTLPSLPPGWDLSYSDVVVGATKFELYLELGEQVDHIEGRLLYSSDLFDLATIRRMEAHWLVLLQAICRNPAASLGHLPFLTTSEIDSMTGPGGWNATERVISSDSVQGLFEKQVARNPLGLAAISGQKRMSYAELDKRSNEIADHLEELGVTTKSVVVIALDRSLDLLAGLIAILKLRATYLPLDIQMPPARISSCLADAQPAAILTQQTLSHLFHQSGIAIVETESITGNQDNQLATSRARSASGSSEDLPADSAYIIYTSGTTGAPKAVEITQRNLINLLTSMQEAPGFMESDTLLAITPVSFDIAALELFLPIITGGTVVIASREQVRDPFLLAEAIRSCDCTVVQATPATWRTLIQSGWNDARQDPKRGAFKYLRVLCGGEALTGDLAERLLATGAELWNMYGPTETTIWSTIYRVESVTPKQVGPISVGWPIANTQAYILDGNLELSPIGVRGELFLGGAGLAKGYRGQTKQTSERFFEVASVGGSRLYRTGDLAQRKADGTIEVLGRSDNQVKIRGFRVELEAVEATAMQHSQVAAAAARVWPEQTGEMRLSLYVVGTGKTGPNEAEIRAFMAHTLPEYMIPSDVVLIESMPLTPNGKTDRSQLPVPSAKKSQPSSTTYLPAEERRLSEIWSTLLGVDQINPDDDFFALGGHSVLVAALQQGVWSAFALRMSMAELFHKPTIRQQAELIREQKANKGSLAPGVFAVQTQGKRAPIFWIHYASEGLATALGEDQPFISIVLTAEDMISLGDEPTLKAIAMFHMQKLLMTQPKGPYQIGGFCVGGVLAYEVACLLRGAGYEVSVLILVDAPNPSPSKLKRVWRYGKWIAGRGGLGAISYTLGKRLEDQRGRVAKKGIKKNEMRTAQEMVQMAVFKYNPKRYEGKVVLIQASERLHMDLFPAWQEVVRKGLETKYVEGHHDDLMKDDSVQAVGKAVLESLSSVSHAEASKTT